MSDKSLTYVVGVDPGVHGGIALIDSNFTVVNLWQMPTISVKTGKKGKNRTKLDLWDLYTLFDGLRDHYDPRVVLEEVHSMPTDGNVSAFFFGWQAGALEALLTSARLEYRLVPPNIWKKALIPASTKKGVAKQEKKEFAIKECLASYPGVNLIPPRCRVPSDGWAEALLLAKWGRIYWQ